MVETEILITNPSGMHTRPAKKVVDAAKKFVSDIFICKGERCENAKTLIKLMKLGITSGSKIIVRCEGEDEELALETITALISSLTE